MNHLRERINSALFDFNVQRRMLVLHLKYTHSPFRMRLSYFFMFAFITIGLSKPVVYMGPVVSIHQRLGISPLGGMMLWIIGGLMYGLSDRKGWTAFIGVMISAGLYVAFATYYAFETFPATALPSVFLIHLGLGWPLWAIRDSRSFTRLGLNLLKRVRSLGIFLAFGLLIIRPSHSLQTQADGINIPLAPSADIAAWTILLMVTYFVGLVFKNVVNYMLEHSRSERAEDEEIRREWIRGAKEDRAKIRELTRENEELKAFLAAEKAQAKERTEEINHIKSRLEEIGDQNTRTLQRLNTEIEARKTLTHEYQKLSALYADATKHNDQLTAELEQLKNSPS